jgi:hypothetical protein
MSPEIKSSQPHLLLFALTLITPPGWSWTFLIGESPQVLPISQPQKGMSYASWWPGQYSHPDADLAFENLADTGAE